MSFVGTCGQRWTIIIIVDDHVMLMMSCEDKEFYKRILLRCPQSCPQSRPDLRPDLRPGQDGTADICGQVDHVSPGGSHHLNLTRWHRSHQVTSPGDLTW